MNYGRFANPGADAGDEYLASIPEYRRLRRAADDGARDALNSMYEALRAEREIHSRELGPSTVTRAQRGLERAIDALEEGFGVSPPYRRAKREP